MHQLPSRGGGVPWGSQDTPVVTMDTRTEAAEPQTYDPDPVNMNPILFPQVGLLSAVSGTSPLNVPLCPQYRTGLPI